MIRPPPRSPLFPSPPLSRSLLGRAAPPDRALPPFRPGDVKPPARLWWQVRLPLAWAATVVLALGADRKSTRLNSSHSQISYAVFCLKKKKQRQNQIKRRGPR